MHIVSYCKVVGQGGARLFYEAARRKSPALEQVLELGFRDVDDAGR